MQYMYHMPIACLNRITEWSTIVPPLSLVITNYTMFVINAPACAYVCGAPNRIIVCTIMRIHSHIPGVTSASLSLLYIPH